MNAKRFFRAANDTTQILSNLHFASILIANAVKAVSGTDGIQMTLKGTVAAKANFISTMQQMPDEDAELLLKFFEWLFNRNRESGIAGRFTSWWYARSFRAHIGAMSDAHEPESAKRFLEKAVTMIKDKPDQEQRHQAVLRYFATLGVPHSPDKSFETDMSAAKHLLSGLHRSGENLVESFVDVFQRADQWMADKDREITDRRAKLTWFQRLLES